MPTPDYQKLERRLALVNWTVRQFGYESNAAMLADVSQVGIEGFSEDGLGHVTNRILSTGKCRIPREVMTGYDENIARHLERINAKRAKPIVLRYYQHLSLLTTEHFLDWYFHQPGELRRSLNNFIDEQNTRLVGEGPLSVIATKVDLRKLAFWMATGCGKTILMHLNLLQFQHYAEEGKQKLDNLLLITPNEGLTTQHLKDFEESGIEAEVFQLNQSGLSHPGVVRVLETTKLVDEKKDGGVRVPVSAFSGNNLIFVDEGHKGCHGKVYREYRDQLGETGFTFEYSATFGQALDAVDEPELTDEYAKSILVDYSYKYFYGDGFGKDFKVMNVDRDDEDESIHILLTANLLSVYEQMLVYEENGEELRPYEIARPLWMFICQKSTGGEAGKLETLRLMRFLHRFLRNENGWSVKTIKAILRGETEMPPENNKAFFSDEVTHLRALWKGKRNYQRLFEDVLGRIFHANGAGNLELCPIRGETSEVALRVEGGANYFGLVKIDKASSTFANLVTENEPEIVQVEDVVGESLFDGVKSDDSPVNLLIGAKMFIEGWSSWRVSSIGLFNVGRSSGAQIIQLFGRGVRLRGLNRSLKRSAYLPPVEQHPAVLPILERLMIFGIRAQYMSDFRGYLEREGVDPGGFIELELELWKNAAALKKEKLIVPKVPPEEDFRNDETLVLEARRGLRVKHDVTVRLSSLHSTRMGLVDHRATNAESEKSLPNALFPLLDWDVIYREVKDYVELKHYFNLAIPREAPREIMKVKDLCVLKGPDSLFEPKSFEAVKNLERAVGSVLKKYVNRFFRNRQKVYETNHMKADRVAEGHPNLAENYRIEVAKGDTALIESIQRICDRAPFQVWKDVTELKNIYFAEHLYQPLLIRAEKKVEGYTVRPPGLEASEVTFIKHLRKWWDERDDSWKGKRKLFLLRNLNRGHGVGFYEEKGFFPDFILWLIEGKAQRVIFIEPHGMAREPITSKKVQLHEAISEYTADLKKSVKEKVEFDAWIVTQTPFREVQPNFSDDGGKTMWEKERFYDQHIGFFEDEDYLDTVFGVSGED